MTRIRRLGALMLAAPLAMAFPVLGATVPANAASTGITSPSNGQVIRGGSSVSVRATYDFSALGMELWADTPGGGPRIIAGRGPFTNSIAGSVDISRNGRYTAQLKGKSSWVYDTNVFYVRIAPAAPTGLSAGGSSGKVTVRWNRGLESDLTGYRVSVSGAGTKSGSDGSLCSGTSCSMTVNASKAGSVPVRVTAMRSTGTGGTISSRASGTTASLGGGSGVSAPNGSAAVNPPNYSAPSSNTPLSPLTGNSPMTLPSVQPEGAPPGFTYPTPSPMVAEPDSVNAGKTSVNDSLQWGKSVAIALVLLVIAAHLGTWTRRTRVAQAGVNSLGMAARMARGGTGRTRVQRAKERIAKAEATAKTAPRDRGRSAGRPAGNAQGGRQGARRSSTQRPKSALNPDAAFTVLPHAATPDVPDLDIFTPRGDWPPRRSAARSENKGRRRTSGSRRGRRRK